MKPLPIAIEDIKELIPEMGFGIATDYVSHGGYKIMFMYREKPMDGMDSGWRFLSGEEDDEYMDNPRNSGLYDVNTLANLDPTIIPHLEAPVGSEFEWDGEGFVAYQED
ncbi:MAG: DUF2185 domain-containing protein [Bacteroidia bacterium]|nr:DUF2185 domain-containing protein [Bacteroidia bacterium]